MPVALRDPVVGALAGAAPIVAVTSASINSWSTQARLVRTGQSFRQPSLRRAGRTGQTR